MMDKTTCNRGDIAVSRVISDLTAKGYKVFMPLSSHLSIDLVAMNPQYKICRVQIKYCKERAHGRIQVRLNGARYNSKLKKFTTPTHDRSRFDGYAIYSAATDKVYYISNKSIPANAKQMFSFRVLSSAIKCRQKVKLESDFADPSALF